jgi:L-amino acid N-acyltransferase YncA
LLEWFAANIQRSDRDVLIYHVGGAPVGYAYIDKCSGHLETSVAVSEKFEGRGLGTKLMTDVVDYIGAHYEQQPIVAWIIERNIASVKIHEKAGYRRAAGTKTVPFGSGASEKMVEFRVVAERH